jgi:hypothetical protein
VANSVPALNPNGVGNTQRTDKWWVEPLLTALVLGSFGIYATLRTFQGEFYHFDPYLSPFGSPPLTEWFPQLFTWYHWSPAILILPFPLVFRATCYYYRKAYYRSFFMDPPACAVGGPAKENYSGESHKENLNLFNIKLPLPNIFVLQNLHRYAFYFAAAFIFFLAYDAFLGYFFKIPGTDQREFGVGIGSLVMTLNVIFLSLYTFSCHSWRHLIGGNLNCFSCDKASMHRHNTWTKQSHLNEHHMLWAWVSLFGVWFADLYVFLCATGRIQDMRLF